MQPRKEHQESGHNLPTTWLTEVKTLLQQNYVSQCKREEKTFEVYGKTYATEVLIAISFLKTHDPIILPTTFMASVNLEADQNEKKLLSTLVDSAGIFFDQYFSQLEDEETCPTNDWEESKLNNIKFWYKVTRENIELSLTADNLLKDS